MEKKLKTSHLEEDVVDSKNKCKKQILTTDTIGSPTLTEGMSSYILYFKF